MSSDIRRPQASGFLSRDVPQDAVGDKSPITVASSFRSSLSARDAPNQAILTSNQLDDLCVQTVLERYSNHNVIGGIQPFEEKSEELWPTLSALGAACMRPAQSSDCSENESGASVRLHTSPPSISGTRTLADIETILNQLDCRVEPLEGRESTKPPQKDNTVGMRLEGVRLLERLSAKRIQRNWRAYMKRQQIGKMYEITAERCRQMVEATLLQTAMQNSRQIERELLALKARRKTKYSGRASPRGDDSMHIGIGSKPSSTFVIGRYLLTKPLASPQALILLNSALIMAMTGERAATLKHWEYDDVALTLITVARMPSKQSGHNSMALPNLTSAPVVTEYVQAFDERFAEGVHGSLWELTLQSRKRDPPVWRYLGEMNRETAQDMGASTASFVPRSLRKGFLKSPPADAREESLTENAKGGWSMASWLGFPLPC